MPYMTEERYKELMDNQQLKLTEAEITEGYHFCPDWDVLLIHKFDMECEFCTCEEHTEEQKAIFAKLRKERDIFAKNGYKVIKE